MNKFSPAARLVAVKVAVFAAALALDVSGKLSPQAFVMATTLVGSLGLTSAVTAFRSTAALPSAVEQVLVPAMAMAVSEVARHVGEAKERFAAYLDNVLDIHKADVAEANGGPSAPPAGPTS